jgi:hypothetical protein
LTATISEGQRSYASTAKTDAVIHAGWDSMSTRRTTLYLNALMDKTITFRIPVALLAKLEKLAQADERSVSFVLRKAVEQYVERHKEGK